MSSSAVRFWLLPILMVPMLRVPGLSRAALTNSAMVLNGEVAFTQKRKSK